MSEPVVEPQGQSQGVVTPPVTEPPVSENPAWAPILEDLPESLHGLITPKLKEWDANVTRKFQENADKYKPWEDVITQADPELVDNALKIVQALESDPKAFYELMAQTYGFTPAQVQQAAQQVQQQQQVVTPPATVDPDDPNSQLIIALQAQLQEQAANQQKLVEYLVGQQQQQQQVSNQQKLDTYLNTIQEANKDLPWDENTNGYILTQMANGAKGEDAIKSLRTLMEIGAKKLTAPSSDAPVVTGSVGGTPSQQVSVQELSDKDRRNLVAQMLAKAHETSD